MKFKVNQIVNLPVFGKVQPVKILAIHTFGTIDVETASGRCYRITGLSL